MNAPLRKVAIAVMVLFSLLFVNLNWVQFVKGDFYRNHPGNNRVLISEYDRQRGYILVDRQTNGRTERIALAESKDTGGELRYTRSYPLSSKYAHLVGYKSVLGGETGIEAAEDAVLSGESGKLFVRRLSDLVTGRRSVGGNVVLTVSPRAQETAYAELGSDRGAVVALDPRTGAILASASTPTFDPNPLASHDGTVVNDAYKKLDADPNKPLLNRGFNESFPPGSTFKVIASAAAIEAGTDPNTVVDGGTAYSPVPGGGFQITNAPGVVCPQRISLKQALTVSCNTAFAKIGVELGKKAIEDKARDFGFGDASLRTPLPISASETGDLSDPTVRAQSCIGQQNVRMVPMMGAMIAATVANEGRQMKPYLVQELQDGRDLSTLATAKQTELRQPISADTADKLREMMVSVVDGGTGTAARISGVEVGGKTGTAENEVGANDHGWFIGFARKDGQPVVAIAVFLEKAGSGGSNRASEIAGKVMSSVLTDRGLK